MLRKLFNRNREQLDWSGLEWLPGQDPLGVMVKHLNKFYEKYPNENKEIVWQRWLEAV